jgi:hypothetical protein
LDRWNAVDNHLIARLQTFFDNAQAILDPAELHVTPLGDVVRTHDVQVLRVLVGAPEHSLA